MGILKIYRRESCPIIRDTTELFLPRGSANLINGKLLIPYLYFSCAKDDDVAKTHPRNLLNIDIVIAYLISSNTKRFRS